MAYEHNDIATKNRLMSGLGEELMGYEHNDIVTVDVMEKAIAEGGGGGSSDFSTAQATIINNSETNFYLTLPNIFDGELYSFLDSSDIESEPVTIPLYGGVLYEPVAIDTDTGTFLNVSITGDYEQHKIKGDCTITIS